VGSNLEAESLFGWTENHAVRYPQAHAGEGCVSLSLGPFTVGGGVINAEEMAMEVEGAEDLAVGAAPRLEALQGQWEINKDGEDGCLHQASWLIAECGVAS
jgi:hypothetical protein